MADQLRPRKQPRARGPAVTTRTRPTPPLVLVAEDHEDTRYLLRMLLEMRGLCVAEAADGEEAVRLAERLRPGLVLMDGSLPRLDGFAAARLIRDSASLSSTPVVFLSGHAEPRFQVLAREAGCADYLTKPIDIAQLDRVLGRHLPQQSRGDSARADDNISESALTHASAD